MEVNLKIKKEFLSVILLVFFSSLVFSEFVWSFVKVKLPNGGESWQLGSEKLIKWEKSGNFTKFQIILRKANIRVGDIARDLDANTTSYLWEKVGEYIGGNVAAGSDYKIRVRGYLPVGSKIDDSDLDFSITEKNTLRFQPVRRKFDLLKPLKPDYTIRVGLNINIAPPLNSKYPSYFNVVIRNIGLADAKESTTDRILLFYHGRQGQIKPTKYYEYWHETINPIKKGKFHYHPIKYYFKAPGKYSIKAWIDDPNNVKEKDENNNFFGIDGFWVSEKWKGIPAWPLFYSIPTVTMTEKEHGTRKRVNV